ncbi:MAG: short-chain dehydrogenase [Gammaproteobacteria bacterium]|jgi:short-subunit dehydrogenase|nr:short-chain dehydrogenase [Gammaproteobacteria bacterium]
MIKTVLIIGANSDIAYECVLAMAKYFSPQNFLLASKNFETLKQTAQDLQLRTHIPCQSLALNVEDLNACQSFYQNLPLKPDCVIYTAGYLGDEIKAENDVSEALKILNINYTGAMILLESAAADMAAKKQGIIVGVSSVAGLRGRKKIYHYGAAKAAFATFLSGLRNRLCSQGVHVMTVLPGFVDTKMTKHLTLPKALTASPQKVAESIVQGIKKSRDVIYAKPVWRHVMLIIRHIPEKIFKRLDL